MAENDDRSYQEGKRDVYWEILTRVEKKVDTVDKKIEVVNDRIDKFFYNEFNTLQSRLARFPDPEKILLKDNFNPDNYVTKKDFRPYQWAGNTIIVILFLTFLVAILAAIGIHPYFDGVIK